MITGHHELQRYLTRRRFLERAATVGVGSGTALALLNACGGPAGADTGITFWNLFGGGDGVRLLQMLDAFRQATPEIQLEAVTLAWGPPYYTKLAMAAAGGRPPDVAVSHMTRAPMYAAEHLLDPFDLDELAEFGITEDHFLPAIWKRGFYDGKLYALPFDTHPFVMFYNLDVCEEAGLLHTDGTLLPLEGPDALIDAFKRTQEITGAWGVSFEAMGVTPWRAHYSLYSQLGGTVLSEDGLTVTIDRAKAEQALTFLSDLTNTHKVSPPTIDYAGSVALFGSGQAAFHWNGEWEISTFLAQSGLNFSMAPFPHVYGDYKVQADSHAFILPRQLAVDPARRSASLRFIGYMLQESLTWAEGGHIPAYLPVAESSTYQALKPQSNYAGVAADTVFDPIAWFSGSGSELENQCGAAFQPVLAGQFTPQQGLDQFHAALQKLLSITPPTVMTGL